MAGTLYKSYVGIMWCYAFYCKKRWHFTGSINISVFSRNIYRKMQYFLITLGQLGYLIAIGRSLFPFFLLRIAMNYSMLPGLRKRKTWVKLSRVIPIMSLILYFPSVYRMIVHNRESMQEIIAKGNMIWINLYLTVSVVILLIEYFSISILFLKRQFQQTVIFLVSISAIYLIYYHQDPGQVYLFLRVFDRME